MGSGANTGSTPGQGMRDAHPIDRVIVLSSGQVKAKDLDSIEIGDMKVTDSDGTVTEIAGMTFRGRRDHGNLGQG